MTKLPKIRCDIYIEPDIYYKLLQKMQKIGLNTISQTTNNIFREYFTETDNNTLAVNRLNKVIQSYEEKINNLEYELRQKKRVSDEKTSK